MDKGFSDVIVIHPGSRFVRVGRASDAFPKQCPHLLVRAIKTPSVSVESNGLKEPTDQPAQQEEETNEEHSPAFTREQIRQKIPELTLSEDALAEIDNEIKKRIKDKKIRVMPNTQGQVISFNSQSEPTVIADHNDPYKIEWTQVGKHIYLGQEVRTLFKIDLGYPYAHYETRRKGF
jgi:actin-related protein 8